MSDELVTSSGGYQRQRQTSPRRVTARERELQAIELRKAGLSYRQIGEALGISHVAAGKAIKRALQKCFEQTREETAELRNLELERLDELNLAFWGKAMAGDTQAGKLILRVIEQRARLLGLGPLPPATADPRHVAPRRVELKPLEPEKVALAEALLRLPATKREYLTSASARGQRPVDALQDLLKDQSETNFEG